MPRLVHALPKYSRHKQSGRAIVRFAHRDVLLPGPYGSPESRAAYDLVVAQWLANGRKLPNAPLPSGSGPAAPSPTGAPSPTELTIAELIVRYLEFADGYYPKRDGTTEYDNLRNALRPLHAMFGTCPVRQFGPKSLKALQEQMARDGLSRSGINARVNRMKRMFRWAGSEELIGPEIPSALATVPGLRRGYTRARESEPVGPVPDAHVDAVRPHVSRQVWAMIELQRLTGMRPGEVVSLRSCDLDTSGPVWTYRPERHKTWSRGKPRSIYLGPRAQAILQPWLRTKLDEPLFQPREADAERKAELRHARRTPVQPSQADRSRPDAVRKPGETYTVKSYGRAIRRACEAAGVPVWGPNRLRHATGTRVRKLFGVEGAQVILGHARADVTQVYAERNEMLAIEIAQRIG